MNTSNKLRMNAELQIDKMTVSEKVDAMEVLWADLSKNLEFDFLPDWHGKILSERSRSLETGEDKVIDWIEAKEQIRKKIDARQNS
jgi:hypothetical protein